MFLKRYKISIEQAQNRRVNEVNPKMREEGVIVIVKEIDRIGTVETMKEEAAKLAEVAGVGAVVDYFLEWADECLHVEINRGLQDTLTDFMYSITGVPRA